MPKLNRTRPRIGTALRKCEADPFSSGCPWQNGRIERFFGTLKQKLDQWQVPDFVQLNRDLDVFRDWYNHVRSHQNLDRRTPAEVWRGADPYAKAPQREQWFEAWDGLLVGYCLTWGAKDCAAPRRDGQQQMRCPQSGAD